MSYLEIAEENNRKVIAPLLGIAILLKIDEVINEVIKEIMIEEGMIALELLNNRRTD